MNTPQPNIELSTEEKKLLLLIKLVVFYYHTLDKSEIDILKETAIEFDANEELEWAKKLIDNDKSSGFEKAKSFLSNFIDMEIEKKIYIINNVWESANKKGYITEMEATALLKLAKDWKIEKELLALVRKK
ncbi:MAG: hypothetical protein SNJ77_03520 [Cytophagales bacterium]